MIITNFCQICDNLFNGSYDDEQKIVQAAASKVEIVALILNTIPMVIFSLFLGPWSDKAGRKMLLIIPLLGSVLLCICFMVNVYFFDALVVEFLWLESISYYFGGYILFFVGAYGYIADTTSLKSRTIRIAVMDGLFSVAETIGNLINVYIYAALGYYGNFGCASLCFLLGVVIVLFTVGNKGDSNDKEEKTKVFDMKTALESFKVLSKARPKNMRHIVIIMFICYEIGNFCFKGFTNVDYLYLRRKFEWRDETSLVGEIHLYKIYLSLFLDSVLYPAALIQIYDKHLQPVCDPPSGCQGVQAP